MFNRPGPRLVDCLEWLASVLLDRPDLAPVDTFPARWLPPQTSSPAPTSSEPPSDPALVEDIEEAHRCAVKGGQLAYIDPSTGYTVYTQLAALERGRCCGSGCRHCPYDHQQVAPERKAKLPKPITCDL
eukprot:8218366-Pyramimonas_sp.AAC.1